MKTALIVTDMQSGFMNEHTIHLVSRLKYLLEQNLFDYIIFTQFINHPKTFYEKLVNFTKLRISPEIDIVKELKPYVNYLFKKNNYTPFTMNFENFLKQNHIKKLYFAGVDTNVCVLLGAADAFNKGYVPVVLGYYCASHSGVEFHRFGLKNLEKIIGKKQVVFGEVKKTLR